MGEEDRQLAGYDLSVSWAVDYWLSAGAKPSQLTIGLGMYGRGWRLTSLSNTGFNAPASGACAAGPSTGEAGYRAYYEIKAEIAAGAMLWALDLDDFAGAYSDKAYPLTSIAGSGGG